jgi:hypothetical protein
MYVCYYISCNVKLSRTTAIFYWKEQKQAASPIVFIYSWQVCRYQRSKQKPYIEGQMILYFQKKKNWQPCKQWSTNPYTENYRFINTNPTNNRRWTRLVRTGRQTVTASLTAPVVLLLSNTSIVWYWYRVGHLLRFLDVAWKLIWLDVVFFSLISQRHIFHHH